MNRTTIRYLEAEDVLHIAIAGGPESRSIELSPTIAVELNDNDEMIGVEILEASSLDEYLAYMSYEAKQEQRAERFALLREAAGQNAAHNQRSGWDDYDDQLVPDAEAKLGALLKFEPAQ